ncbi:hypothetical protein AACT_0203 [Arcobacter acticola]|jgi:hypothetical protein|uniref:DUF4145 domain-containing protein n=1 Tax=Arcobacter acticola TaxID=1849015 RepID=A0A6M8EVX6_9BACT|nr:hypothetical protein [Arcobacter acticola]QKE27434.1 hypothetical protein AACT_0203 [Arcobacter acticola]
MGKNENLSKKSKHEDIGRIVEFSKRLETFLQENYKAEGKGLHEKISSIEDKLLADFIEVRILRKIATIRNKIVHDDNFEFEGIIDEFEDLFQIVFKQLEIAKNNKERKVNNRNNPEDKFINKNKLKDEDNKYSKFIKILIGITVVLFLYYSVFSENPEIIKENIKEINKIILLEEEKLNNLHNKLKKEQEKQGTLRTFFYDNEVVNDLEKQIKMQNDNLNIFIKELNKEEKKL